MGNKYIICGASRAGKSILSEKLSREQNVNWILGDALVSSFQDAFPKVGISHDGDLHAIGNRFEEFIKFFLWNYNYARIGYVFDSTHLYPRNVINIREKIGNIPVVFLGYPNISALEKLSDIRRYDPSGNWWTRNLSDDELLNMINQQIEKSKHLEIECKKFELPFIEVGKNFEATLSQAVEILKA